MSNERKYATPWERINFAPTPNAINTSLYRLKVPSGWLVIVAVLDPAQKTEHNPAVFVPDPTHEWDPYAG